jgi:orotate phosphoribosyltransferase
MDQELMQLVHARKGHFLLESGHHGDLWLDLELLCLHPERVQPFASELAKRLTEHRLDAVCGPLVEGAFVALLVAVELGVEFIYTERLDTTDSKDLFSVGYRIPAALRREVHGKRIGIVNDVINAGSAVRGTYADLKSHGAQTVAVASLLTLGDSAEQLAKGWNIDLVRIASQPNTYWTPSECPLCSAGMPVERHDGPSNLFGED